LAFNILGDSVRDALDPKLDHAPGAAREAAP
jgi:ABC-type dipeptide/oligopeptide/nickel transport system permease subunit